MTDKISNVRKRELEQPDPFLESMYNALDVAKQYKKQLAILGIAVATIVSIISITFYTIRSSETKASIILTNALKTYKTDKQPIDGFEAVKEQFSMLLNEYPNTSSGKIGKVRFGQICYEAGKYDMAYKHYSSALDDFKNDSAMYNILLSSLGHTCQAQKKYEEANNYFKKIADGENTLMKDDALFNLGMVNILNGDNLKGIDFLKKLSSNNENSMYKTLADEIIARN